MEMKHHVCRQCGVRLTSDEKAIYMKMVSRSAVDFLCLDCLSEKLGCSRGALQERIQYYIRNLQSPGQFQGWQKALMTAQMLSEGF